MRRVRAAGRVRPGAGDVRAGVAGRDLAAGGQCGVEQLVDVGQGVVEVFAVARGQGRQATGLVAELLEVAFDGVDAAGEAGVVVSDMAKA